MDSGAHLWRSRRRVRPKGLATIFTLQPSSVRRCPALRPAREDVSEDPIDRRYSHAPLGASETTQACGYRCAPIEWRGAHSPRLIASGCVATSFPGCPGRSGQSGPTQPSAGRPSPLRGVADQRGRRPRLPSGPLGLADQPAVAAKSPLATVRPASAGRRSSAGRSRVRGASVRVPGAYRIGRDCGRPARVSSLIQSELHVSVDAQSP